MAPAKAALKLEPIVEIEPVAEEAIRSASAPDAILPRLPNGLAVAENPTPQTRPVAVMPTVATRPRSSTFQPRVPIVTGEATFRGMIPVDGIVSGQLGAHGGGFAVKQRPRTNSVQSEPELIGEITFKDMLRINGHVAGKVISKKGTLIVDPSALIDGDIDVGVVVISGVVKGDVIAHERVELGPAARIYGNISTRALTMKPGAVFQGDCRMFTNEDDLL